MRDGVGMLTEHTDNGELQETTENHVEQSR